MDEEAGAWRGPANRALSSLSLTAKVFAGAPWPCLESDPSDSQGKEPSLAVEQQQILISLALIGPAGE